MKTKLADCKTDIARLTEDSAGREARTMLATAALIAQATTILGFIITTTS